MTLEGGKPLVENADEVGWTAAAFDYYAEMGRNFAPGHSVDRVDPARPGGQGAGRRLGLHRAVELPPPAAGLEAGARAGRGQYRGGQAFSHPGVDPDAGRMLRSPAARRLQRPRRRRPVGEAIVRDERVAGVAFTGSVETGKRVAGLCAERVAHMNLEMGGKDPFIVCADVAGDVEVAAKAALGRLPERRSGVHLGRALLRRARGVRRLRLGVRRLTACCAWVTPWRRRPTWARWCRQASAKVEAQVEAAVAAGAEVLMGGDRAGQERGHYFAPAVVTGAARETELLSEETFGPVAPIVPVSSLDEAISLPTQPASASARTSTRATSRLRSAACVRSEPAPCGSTIR